MKKAESDHRVAVGLETGVIPSASDQICYLCQQSAEKYLKALLEEAGQSIPKTHDLLVLLGLVQTQHPSIVAVRRGLSVLIRYGIAPRYPGFSASKRQATAAVRWANRTREECRTLLGIRSPRKKST